MIAFRRLTSTRLLSLSKVPITRILSCRYNHLSTRAEKPFEILFLGRDEFSCVVLEQLHKAQDVWDRLELVTQPDVKTGRRGSTLSVSPLKVLGQALDLPVHTIPPDRPSFRTWQPPVHFITVPPPTNRLLVTASFGRILPKALLNLFVTGRRLNVHPSLLPAYRGAAPIQHTLMDGRSETGVCVIEMMERKKGIDAGEIWGMETMAVPKDVGFSDLRDELAVRGGRLLVSVLRDMLEGKASSLPQEVDSSAPLAPLITADDALVAFSRMTAADIVRLDRAISHQKILFARLLTGQTVQLQEPSVFNESKIQMDSIPLPGMAVYHPPTKSLVVRCAAETLLRVEKLKTENKNLVSAKEWWNGVRPEWRANGTGKGAIHLVH